MHLTGEIIHQPARERAAARARHPLPHRRPAPRSSALTADDVVILPPSACRSSCCSSSSSAAAPWWTPRANRCSTSGRTSSGTRRTASPRSSTASTGHEETRATASQALHTREGQLSGVRDHDEGVWCGLHPSRRRPRRVPRALQQRRLPGFDPERTSCASAARTRRRCSARSRSRSGRCPAAMRARAYGRGRD